MVPGEQRQATSRLGMQDVIFNGSARREPPKYAQVKDLEAAGTSFPKPWNRYEELEICRR